MNLFDQLVNEALKNQPDFSNLRVVVEKELLHHDILRILNQMSLLKDLTFIGGTCLRCCYSGVRLSEDLDFTGGSKFTRASLSTMASALIKNLQDKYSLSVKVSEPVKDSVNVDTWKISIETRPGRKDLPAQRINIDVCAVPTYEKMPMLLLNPYGVDMGTNGLIIQAQSREEIYLDKVIAFVLRPNRIKYRDLWDIIWLHQQGLKPRFELLARKLQDRNFPNATFLRLYEERKKFLSTNKKCHLEFMQEMQRFLPAKQINNLNAEELINFVIYLMNELGKEVDRYLK